MTSNIKLSKRKKLKIFWLKKHLKVQHYYVARENCDAQLN